MIEPFGKWVVRKLLNKHNCSRTKALEKIEEMTCEDLYELIHKYRK